MANERADPSAPRIRGALRRVAAIAASFALVSLLCALMGASPIEVAARLWGGAFGTADQAARVLTTLSPLLLCASGLVFTFRAGLYNLGVEGQIVAGAIAATFAARALEGHLPPALVVASSIAAGALGGSLWGAAAGALHVRARVSEIFAGLGMNFVAQGAALYLIFGPWKRPGVASMAGTEPMDKALWLSTFGATDASPAALALGVLSVAFAAVLMRSTHFGLRLRAVGLNRRAAEILGVPAARQLLGAFAISGALAGVAGALQVLGVFHRLIPSVSSNLGFLALLVTLLAGSDPLLVAPVALFFSALNVGSLQLPLTMQLESSLSGVLQGALVLFALLAPRGPGGGAPRAPPATAGARPPEGPSDTSGAPPPRDKGGV
jgi:simple sugar transport system permease protein